MGGVLYSEPIERLAFCYDWHEDISGEAYIQSSNAKILAGFIVPDATKHIFDTSCASQAIYSPYN